MADEVDASMQPVHTPSPDPLLDCTSPKPNFFELAAGYHPVLPLRNLSQPPVVIASPRKSISKMTFRGLGWHPASVAGSGSILGRGLGQLSRGRCA